MDSVSHTRVARILLDYVKETCGVNFDTSAFIFGNLKPDLKGEYFSKRHYPSVMFDEVMQKIIVFTEKYSIGPVNDRELSVDLGEICHYMTDFFCFPHNDDIYNRNLFAHYLYEKRIAFRISKKIDQQKFEKWVAPVTATFTVDALINRIKLMHDEYKNQNAKHCIADDMIHICRICTMVVMSVINICYEVVVDTSNVALA